MAIAVAALAACLWPEPAVSQDAPIRVSCQVAKLTANGKEHSQVQYATFNSVKRANEVKNELKKAVLAEEAVGAKGTEIDDAMQASRGRWRESRPNGTFDVSVMAGQAIVVFCDKQEVHIFEIREGQDHYEATVEMRRSIRTVVVEGTRRLYTPQFKKVPSMDTGYETQFNINVVLPEGWTKDNSRLIIQPMAIDCQTEDTISYLPAVVFEGADYHSKQDRRMRFDYFAHDQLAHAYHSSVTLASGELFAMDTTITFVKPDKDKTYKGIYYCVLEDYHRDYYNNGGEGTGSCLAFRPFKFLDFSVAAADMDLSDFKVEAESQYSTVPRNLMLTFVGNSDELTADSVNDIEFGKLIDELKTYGDKLFRVSVEGTASPEGNYQHNMALAGRRAARALSIIRSGLGANADVQLPQPTVRVYTWDDVVTALEENGTDTSVVAMVRNVVSKNDASRVNSALRALPFYENTIVPILEKQRNMKCAYSYERDHVMSPEEAVQAYYAFKPDYIAGKKRFSDGDFYNLFATIRDSAELDTITEMAYSQMVRQPGYEKLTLSPYVANRKAMLNIRRGVPDVSVLKPFIDYADRRVPASKSDGGVIVTKNFRELIINQSIMYFQEQHLDTAQYLVDWVSKDSITDKIEKFINFERYFIKYIQGQCTPEEQAVCADAYNYVVESSDLNKAVIYSELYSQLDKTREEAEFYVDKMDDGNAKKWYLKGILWSEEAGKEASVDGAAGFKELSDREYMLLQRTDPAAAVAYNEERNRYYEAMAAARADKTPYFLAYFQHSFDLEPKYRRLYANEGNVSDDIRDKFPYKQEEAEAYRRKFDMLYAESRKKAAQSADAANGVAASAADVGDTGGDSGIAGAVEDENANENVSE